MSLTKGVLKTMLLNNIKMTALIVLLVGGMTAGVGIWAIQASHATTRSAQAGEQAPPKDFARSLTPSQSTVSLRSLRQGKLSDPFLKEQALGMGLSFPSVRLEKLPEHRPPYRMPAHSDGVHGARRITGSQRPGRRMSLEPDHPRWSKIPVPTRYDSAAYRRRRHRGSDDQGNDDRSCRGVQPLHRQLVSTQMLLKPVEDEINPVIGPGYALYQAGNDFYAFSSTEGNLGSTPSGRK